MIVLLIVALAGMIIYTIKTEQWLRSWKEMPDFEPERLDFLPLSVVIAFRNESGTIRDLIHDLMCQEYPAELIEVIFVDDHSDDHSVELVKEITGSITVFKCIPNKQSPGKKGALATGIIAAKNELIITTDADVRLSSSWLALMSTFYSRYRPSLIIGLVGIINNKHNFFQRFFAAEHISLIAAGAGSAARGNPTYCSGASLAFQKSDYLAHRNDLKMHTASGDDTFLLHALKRSRKKIFLLKSIRSLVRVEVPEDIKQFMRQHIRWASKSRFYTDRDILFTALVVFLVNISIVTSLILLITQQNLWLFGVLFLAKAIADFRLLDNFYSYLNSALPIRDYLLFSFLYPFYLTFTAFSGLFAPYNWKGRKY